MRDESKLLLVEVYKWIGKQTLLPMIQNVKPIQASIFLLFYRIFYLYVVNLDARITM